MCECIRVPLCTCTWLLRLTDSLLKLMGWGQSALRKTWSWIGWSTWKLGARKRALHWTETSDGEGGVCLSYMTNEQKLKIIFYPIEYFLWRE